MKSYSNGKLSNLEFFTRLVETGEAPAEGSRFIYPPTIAKTLGFRLIEVGPGTATMELLADTETHANPVGTVHGGVLCDIADAAIGTAQASGPKEDESFSSIDLQINFFRPVWNGRIRAVAKAVNDRLVVTSATSLEMMTSWLRKLRVQ